MRLSGGLLRATKNVDNELSLGNLYVCNFNQFRQLLESTCGQLPDSVRPSQVQQDENYECQFCSLAPNHL